MATAGKPADELLVDGAIGLWESLDGFSPGFPRGGGLQAAPAKGCGLFRRCVSFSAGAEERDAANPMGRPAMPGRTGNGSGRGDVLPPVSFPGAMAKDAS
jgi:hypothetical protein